MNGEIKVAVCDDLEEDRQVLVNLLSEYTDKNNLYVKIQEFTSGEAFLASDTSEYSLVFMDIFMDGINGMETAKALIVRNRLCLKAPVRNLQRKLLTSKRSTTL